MENLKKDYYIYSKKDSLEYNKEYREKNKDKLCKKIECPCGNTYQYRARARHYKSAKHKKYLESLEE